MVDFGQFLDFERPVVEIEEELGRVRALVESGDLSWMGEIERLEKRLEKVRAEVYDNLDAYQRVRLSRHFERPFTLDYIGRMISDFIELKGDRLYADDPAIVGGIGRFEGQPVVIVGHQRGRTTQERIKRNFGMSLPEGSRKGQRLFKLAEKFELPLLLFIDTQGAYPGVEAEARGQAEAIARNLFVLAGLRTRIISVVIGEGGSGGALALGVCDRLLMLENSTYSVITPEGCASILWGKTETENISEYAAQAAESLKLTAQALAKTGIVDEVVKEPRGGAHRDHGRAAELLAQTIAKHLSELRLIGLEDLLELRYKKFRGIGAF
ncbi:MAG TPA: acetyl-CoA carboxylase carboxyltransferase subunit alpha [Oligoflexia bacterium]|nr:acetyl-CoA carboxylase carboxyltransferase subunit alpha [Oligoflexia bacterium]